MTDPTKPLVDHAMLVDAIKGASVIPEAHRALLRSSGLIKTFHVSQWDDFEDWDRDALMRADSVDLLQIYREQRQQLGDPIL